MVPVRLLVVVVLGALAPAAAPETASEPPPNVVFVLTDDQTLEALSIGLPFLDSQPGGHWVRFEQTFANTPLCCPSRATILSGRYAHETGVVDTSSGAALDDTSTVATWLDDAGYRTGLVGKYLNRYPFPRRPEVSSGWDYWAALRGKPRYNRPDTTLGDDVVAGGLPAYTTDLSTEHALRFLEDPSPDPFFLYLAYYAPHAPRRPAPRHDGAFAELVLDHRPSFSEADVSDKPGWVQALPPLSEKRIRVFDRQRRAQYETLLAVDEGVRAIYDALASAGELDDTVIMFMTDNGFAFGEHRHKTKRCPYEECIRTPLLVRYPDGPTGGRTLDDLVSNADIAPTIAALADVTPATPVDGRSLVPLLDGPGTNRRDGVLLELRAEEDAVVPRYWGVRAATHKWIEYDHGERELYDLVADPYELDNIAGTDPRLEADLHAELVSLRGF